MGAIDTPRRAATDHDNDAEPRLARAADALAWERPHLSARRRLTPAQVVAILILAAALIGALIVAPDAAAAAAAVAFSMVFGLAVSFRLAAALASLAREKPAGQWRAPLPRYTLLCPLHREAAAVPALVEALRAIDYPQGLKQIILVLEADDHATVAAARAFDDVEIVLTPPGEPRTKPKALNYALPQATGAFVTVYDAEDRPHPRQLLAALDAFAAGGAGLACVQAPLLVDNDGESWISGQFAAEYAILFRQLLPLLHRLRAPVILGGTSNHFRREALETCGGWDPYNVTEDADIGYRLAREGWRLGLIDEPTWEEAPTRLPAWVRQRSRWIKGHIQTWLVLMRRPRALHRELGPAGFWTMQLVLLGGVIAAFAHAPFLLLLGWLAVHGRFEPLAFAGVGYAAAAFAAILAALDTRAPRVAVAALTMPLYWPLSFAAAMIAGYEFALKPFRWAKTDHAARRRRTPPTCPQPSPPPSSRSAPRSAPSEPGGCPVRPIP